MDFSLRTWLIITSIIILVGIIYDAFRRSKFKFKFKLDNNLAKNEPTTETLSVTKTNPKIEPITDTNLELAEIEAEDVKVKVKVNSKLAQSKHEARSPLGTGIKTPVTINLHSNNDEGFNGIDLYQVLLEHGLQIGVDDLFHLMHGDNLLFSVSNACNQPHFKDIDVASFTTPAISFFIAFPNNNRNSQRNFDLMLDKAQKIACELGGYLQDENFHRLTSQTIEYNRQIISELERQQKNLNI